MSERSSSSPAGPVAAPPADDTLADQRPFARPPDRRHRRSWVPVTAAWLCLLIGLADIVEVVLPSVYVHTHLHKINHYVPGTLTNLPRVADVLTGLLLLMLSHALRRRKRRAWQAVTLLLASVIAVHLVHLPHSGEAGGFVHLPHAVPAIAIVAAVVLVAMLYFRDEFYAVGDPRTRWRALEVFVPLVVADVAIGLTYILLARGLQRDY